MSNGDTLKISDLRANVDGKPILNGVNVEIGSGEIHAIMGPNGAGKSTLSHILMGREGYEVVSGSAKLGETELLKLPTWERARAGLFLALQYPTEVPGVSLSDLLDSAVAHGHLANIDVGSMLETEAANVGLDPSLIERDLNVDMSGGEKKRNETLQLAVLQPRFAILDELDSGLDIDALRAVARRIKTAVDETNLGVLAITHYSRFLTALQPDFVHVLVDGVIVESGGPELADQLEASGYGAYGVAPAETVPTSSGAADPFADPLL